MKRVILLGILSGVMLISCLKNDESNPLVADFSATITGESPNARVVIENNSKGATNYQWTFGKGASITESTKELPEEFLVDKAGDLSITLIVSNGSEEKELTKKISIPGHTAIETYKNLEFGLEAGDTIYGRCFSFETGKMYLDSEINEENGSKIHLAFGSMEHVMYYFDCPTDESYNIPNATETKITNWERERPISVSDFDSMVDDRLLSGLTIEHTEESFLNGSIPHTVLFEISSGRKGVIKTRVVNSSRLLVDIKVQKY